jgi:hypothetical protein
MSKAQRRAFNKQAEIEQQQKAKEAAETSVVSTIVTTVTDDQNIQAQQKPLVESTDDQNVKPQQTHTVEEERKKQDDAQQQETSSSSQATDTTAELIKTRVATQAALEIKILEMQKADAAQQGVSVGSIIDSWKTKPYDKWYGHASMVVDDITNGRLKLDTDGKHRIDRAIDEYKDTRNYKGLIDFIVLCGAKKIAIPLEYLKTARNYFTEIQKQSEQIKLVLDDMIIVSNDDKEATLEQAQS